MSTPSRLHLPSAAQFGLASLATLLFLGSGFGLYALSLAQLLRTGSLQALDAVAFVSAGAILSIGLVSLPSVVFGFARLIGRPITRVPSLDWGIFRYSIILVPIVIGIGYVVSRIPELAWLLLPPLHILAMGLPLLWYLSIGARGLELQSPQRSWGSFGSGMGLSLVPILLLEGVVGLIVLVIITLLLSSQPEFITDLQSLGINLSRMVEPDPKVLLPFLEKYFLNLPVLGLGGLYVAVFVPLIEEALKPIGMIFLNRRTLTPAGGFLAGMLSGAGFAFIESVLQAAGGEDWWVLVTGRIGTGLVHMTNSGLVGWGIALAIRERAYLSLLGRYALAVLIHGMWNGLAVMASLGYTPALEIEGFENINWEAIGLVSSAALVVLAIGTLILLSRINRTLRQQPLSGLESAQPPGLPSAAPGREAASPEAAIIQDNPKDMEQ
jgi:hypothetical protein